MTVKEPRVTGAADPCAESVYAKEPGISDRLSLDLGRTHSIPCRRVDVLWCDVAAFGTNWDLRVRWPRARNLLAVARYT